MKTKLFLVLVSLGMMFIFSGAALAQSTPERIAGYDVLGVRNSDNTTCYSADVPTVILKASALSQEDLFSGDGPDNDAIDSGLQSAGFPEGTTIMIFGPDLTKSMVSDMQDDWNSTRESNGCIQFGGGSHDPEENTSAGPMAVGHIDPGYSTIVDSEIGPFTDHNAQSVLL